MWLSVLLIGWRLKKNFNPFSGNSAFCLIWCALQKNLVYRRQSKNSRFTGCLMIPKSKYTAFWPCWRSSCKQKLLWSRAYRKCINFVIKRTRPYKIIQTVFLMTILCHITFYQSLMPFDHSRSCRYRCTICRQWKTILKAQL